MSLKEDSKEQLHKTLDGAEEQKDHCEKMKDQVDGHMVNVQKETVEMKDQVEGPKSDSKTEHANTNEKVKEVATFSPSQDATRLEKAMKGFGTDEQVIIDIVTARSNEHRQQIGQQYNHLFGKELVKQLKSELSGNFLEAILALMTPEQDYLARCVNRAVAGVGTDERQLIGILCTVTNDEIQQTKASYVKMYGRPMEKDVAEDTSGPFATLLNEIIKGNRNESHDVDPGKAAMDAKGMCPEGSKHKEAYEAAVTQVIVSQSYAQLRATFAEYEKLYQHSIEIGLAKTLSGEFLDALLTLVSCVRDKVKCFAEQLNKATKGLGTDDENLIRVIVSRSQIDLKDIKEVFHKCYGKSLTDIVKAETSGDYRKVLLGIIEKST